MNHEPDVEHIIGGLFLLALLLVVLSGCASSEPRDRSPDLAELCRDSGGVLLNTSNSRQFECVDRNALADALKNSIRE